MQTIEVVGTSYKTVEETSVHQSPCGCRVNRRHDEGGEQGLVIVECADHRGLHEDLARQLRHTPDRPRIGNW